MCDSCPAHIMGPGEVAAKVARSKLGRRVVFLVVFWGLCIPMLPFAVWGIFGWWTVALAALGVAGTAVGVVYMKVMQRHMVIAAPASLRAALPAPRRAVALPRNLAITRKRQALPAAARALPAAVVTGKVVPAPAHGKVVR